MTIKCEQKVELEVLFQIAMTFNLIIIFSSVFKLWFVCYYSKLTLSIPLLFFIFGTSSSRILTSRFYKKDVLKGGQEENIISHSTYTMSMITISTTQIKQFWRLSSFEKQALKFQEITKESPHLERLNTNY